MDNVLEAGLVAFGRLSASVWLTASIIGFAVIYVAAGLFRDHRARRGDEPDRK